MENLPPITQNNSRLIVRSLMKSINKYPSKAKAQKLESFVEDISVDFDEYSQTFDELQNNNN